jgi:uncharacterized OB-fold protein
MALSSDLRPIAERLFTWPSDTPQLIGSRCNRCGTVAFPAQDGCARCTAADSSEHLLAREGTLWTWTVQGFRPKSPPYVGPAEFVPFPLGYVELPGEVKVETRLVDVDPADLRIGMPMELAIVPFETESGDAVLTFAFRPIAGGNREEPAHG